MKSLVSFYKCSNVISYRRDLFRNYENSEVFKINQISNSDREWFKLQNNYTNFLQGWEEFQDVYISMVKILANKTDSDLKNSASRSTIAGSSNLSKSERHCFCIRFWKWHNDAFYQKSSDAHEDFRSLTSSKTRSKVSSS